MSLAALSGWRIPRERLIEIAAYTLPGGGYTFTGSGAGESGGWKVYGAGGSFAVVKWANPGGDAYFGTWLATTRVPESELPPGWRTYAEAASLSYRVRATLLSGTPPSSGGLDTWLALDSGDAQSWWLNTGGSPGESASCSLRLEIAEYLQDSEAVGPVLASGAYSFTVTRT